MTCCSLDLKLGCMRSHDRQIYFKKCCYIYLFLVQSPKDGKLLPLEWGMIHQVSSIIFPDENSCVRCEYSKESHKLWCITYFRKFFEFLVRPCLVVGKYLEIFHLGSVSLPSFWEQYGKCRWPSNASLKITWYPYPKSSTGREGYVTCLVLSGSVDPFNLALPCCGGSQCTDAF